MQILLWYYKIIYMFHHGKNRLGKQWKLKNCPDYLCWGPCTLCQKFQTVSVATACSYCGRWFSEFQVTVLSWQPAKYHVNNLKYTLSKLSWRSKALENRTLPLHYMYLIYKDIIAKWYFWPWSKFMFLCVWNLVFKICIGPDCLYKWQYFEIHHFCKWWRRDNVDLHLKFLNSVI